MPNDKDKDVIPLRILQVVPLLGYGGVEKIICRYFAYIDRSSFSFDFVCHGPHEPYHDDLIGQGCRIFYISTMGQIGYKAYKKAIQREITLSDYDIIHIHVGHLTGVYASAYRALCRAKIICHAHTTRCMSRGAFLMPVFRCLSRYYADELLACGKEAGRFCFGKSDFKVLPNALAFKTPLNKEAEPLQALRREFGIASDAPIIGHVGHFSAPKNHRFIVSIAQALVQVLPTCKIILVGEGPGRPAIEQAVVEGGVTDRIIFAGVRNDVPLLMNLFDVFILPSLHEGLPLVGIESQAAGTPCLISDTVDRSVDMGIGLCDFLPISEGTTLWADTIADIVRVPRMVSPDTVFQAMYDRGYEITSAKNNLENIYRKLIEYEVTS